MSATSEPISTDAPETPIATAPSFATALWLASDAARLGAEFARTEGGTDPFAAAVRATMMPMVVSDARQPDNPIVFVNNSFCELSGYDRTEIVGRNCRFLQGPKTDRAAVGRIRTAIATRQAIEIDILNYRKDGHTFWNRLRMAPVYDAAGQIAYFFASQIDVTLERELLNELRASNLTLLAENAGHALELAESEARLALAIEAGRLGVFEHDLTSDELTASPRMREHFGHSDEQSFTLASLRAAVHPDDLSRLLERLDRALAGEAELDVEHRVVRPGHAVAWLRVRALILRDPAGRPTRMVGTSSDVTVEVEAAAAQRMLTELLELRVAERTRERDRLWQGSRDLLLVLDGDGVMLAVNPAWTGLLGWTENELVGHAFGEVVHPDDLAASLRALGEAARGTTLQFESRCRRRDDGSTRRIEWTVSSVDGHVTAIGRDVTAEREAVARLQAAEATLRQSQKMEAVGQLTGGIAHDFNNLLTGMLGALELIETRLAQGRTGELGRCVEVARQSAERASALTQRLLAFSRNQALDPQPVRCDRLISDLEELIRRTIGSQITFVVQVPSSVWTTVCDANQLENALLNLCINARDAMPDGGRLTVSARNRAIDAAAEDAPELRAGDYISLSVSDTGTGMPPDVVSRAFEPFYTTKPVGQGTGLGLSMTYGFARQSGGAVQIKSRMGEGTTVTLHLPRHEPVEPSYERSARPTLRKPASGTVLVVEDETAISDVILDVLRERGVTAMHAADGAAALALLRSGDAVDVLLSDIGLPGDISGRRLAAIVRREWPATRMLLMTGHAELAEAATPSAAEPAAPVLHKPFAMEMLADRVVAMLNANGR